MSANCSVVVTLSRFSRPCRTQCCSAKCLISTCFESTRSQTCCHANARRCVFLQTSSHGVSQLSSKFASPQELTSTNSCQVKLTCRVKLTFTTAQSLLVSVFETNQPRIAPPSINRPPVVDLRFSSRSAHDPSHQPTNSVNCSRGRTNSRCMSRVP